MIKVKKKKDLFIDIINYSFKLYNKKSKSGHYKNSTNSPNKLNQYILNIKNKIKYNTKQNILFHTLSNYKTLSPYSKTFFTPLKNKSIKSSRIPSFSNLINNLNIKFNIN